MKPMNWKPWKTRCHEIVLLLDILEGHTQLSRSTTCLVQVENVSCDTFLKASDASARATKDSWHLESCWRALNDYCSIWSSRSSLPAHTANAEKPRIFEVRSGSLWNNEFERLCFAAKSHCYFKIRFLCSLRLWSLLHLVNLLHKGRRDTRTTRISLLICNWRLCCWFFSCPLPKVKYLSDTETDGKINPVQTWNYVELAKQLHIEKSFVTESKPTPMLDGQTTAAMWESQASHSSLCKMRKLHKYRTEYLHSLEVLSVPE